MGAGGSNRKGATLTEVCVSGTGVQLGQLLAGKYRVERILGVGGMGVVVAARHLHLDERVALKLLLPRTRESPGAAERFVAEARAAARIKSEHVVRVTDVGMLEDGGPYMVMEYLEGVDLSAWLTHHGTMQVEQAVDLVLQACEAVAEVHALGMVHRDLKPANLFCVPGADGLLSVKLLDFGLSTLGTHDRHAVLGSPLYMSPEQPQSSGDVDGRADLWSLGVILYEVLAGRTPFRAESVPELTRAHASTRPAPLGSLRSDVPPALQEAIATCLEHDRDRRFASVPELAAAIGPFCSEHGQESVRRLRVRQDVASLEMWSDTPSEARRRRLQTLTPFELGDLTFSPPSHAAPMLGDLVQTHASRRPGGKAAMMWMGILATLGVLAAAGASTLHRAAGASTGDTGAALSALPPAAPAADATSAADAIAVPTLSVSDLPSLPRSTASPRPSSSVRRPSCDPPYVVDDAGITRFTLECFTKK